MCSAILNSKDTWVPFQCPPHSTLLLPLQPSSVWSPTPTTVLDLELPGHCALMLSALLVLPWPCGKAALGAPSKDRGGVASRLSSSWFWGAHMEPAPTLTSLASGSTLWRPLPTGNFLSPPGCISLPHGLLIWVLCFTPPFQFLRTPEFIYSDSTQYFFLLGSALGEVTDH